MIEENIFYNYMKQVILKGGKKKIVDVDHVIFFYMKNKKDLEYLNLDSKSKTYFMKTGFPSIYVGMISNNDGDQFDIVFPTYVDGEEIIKFDELIEDYKNNKISDKLQEEHLNFFMKIFVISHLKNGIFKGTDIKINLLKNTKLSFVNALAFIDKDIKKYFSKFNKKDNSGFKNKTIEIK